MKLNWFSPLPPAKSGVADYVWHVLPQLRHHAEVTMWSFQEDWDPRLEKLATIRRPPHDANFWRELNQGDMTFYHIGNNSLFHSEIWNVSRKHSGVMILHDYRLHHFFTGIYLNILRDNEGYRKLMEQFYGERGVRAADRLLGHECNSDDLAVDFPLTPAAVEGALGVVTHTRQGFDSLRDRVCWPLARLALPYQARPRPTSRPESPTDGVVRLIIFGHLGTNRRIEAVLEALAQLPEKERFRLDVYGEAWDPAYLEWRRECYGLTHQVFFHGFVSEETLEHSLENADLAINLRYPTMGEASFSQLKIWEHELPSLVSRTGWFMELGDDTVHFVHPENEIEDICNGLRTFIEKPEHFIAMGKKGRRFLDREHDPAFYCRQLLEIASRAIDFRPAAAARKIVQRSALEIGCWPAPNARELAVGRLSAALIGFLEEAG